MNQDETQPNHPARTEASDAPEASDDPGSLGEQSISTDEPLEEVLRTHDRTQLAVVKSMLSSSGIPSLEPGTNLSKWVSASLLGPSRTLPGGDRLLVRRSDAADARRLIEGFAADEPFTEPELAEHDGSGDEIAATAPPSSATPSNQPIKPR
jgi:hypothetical protein